jgi:hypothetical protein
MATMLSAADLNVDHVTVAGKDLKELQSRLAAVGISSDYGGPHSNHATEMALTVFPDGSYLELIALQSNPDQKAVAAHYWSKQMMGNAGPAAWAVRAPDIAAEATRLRTAGITVTPPARSGRKRPDGTQLDWETAQVGVEPNGTFFPFLIRDITPRESRVLSKTPPTANKFSGVKYVVIAVRDLKASTARYKQAYGLTASEAVDENLGARLASFTGTPVVLAVPLNAKSWLTQRLDQFGEGPCAFVLSRSPNPSKRFSAVIWFDAAKLGWHLGTVD